MMYNICMICMNFDISMMFRMGDFHKEHVFQYYNDYNSNEFKYLHEYTIIIIYYMNFLIIMTSETCIFCVSEKAPFVMPIFNLPTTTHPIYKIRRE